MTKRALIICVLLCLVATLKAATVSYSINSGQNDCVSDTQFRYDTLATSTIHFRHDRTIIDSTYLDNRNSLAVIKAALESIVSDNKESIASIIIEGSSSPIGHEVYNQRLSLRRAKKAESYLRTISGFQDVDMMVVGKGEDWQTFIEDITEKYSRKNRQQLLDILNSDIPNKDKKQKIQRLDSDGTTWRHLVVNYMTTSRHAVTIVVVKKTRVIEVLPAIQEPKDVLVAHSTGLAVYETPVVKEEPAPSKEASIKQTPITTVRTNLLVPALNAGAELSIGNNWSVAADYYFPWFWPNQKNKNCFEFLGWSVEGRYWFGRDRQPQDRLKGHSVGLYVAGGYYDFEKNYRGMQGEFVSPGLDYTYSMAIGRQKNLNLQFTLAVGYIRSWGRTYNVYGDYGQLYPDEGTVIWDYVGPTKAAVTLVVPLNRREGSR